MCFFEIVYLHDECLNFCYCTQKSCVLQVRPFALYCTFVGVHFGSALSSKSGIALPMLKLLTYITCNRNQFCLFFVTRERKLVKIIVRHHRYSKYFGTECNRWKFTLKTRHSKITLRVRRNNRVYFYSRVFGAA